MTDELNEKFELLLKNCSVINRKFLFKDAFLCLTASLIFTSADKLADAEMISRCRKILNKNTGLTSNLRANPKLVILSKMALSNDPEKYLSDVSEVYKKIHHGTQLENSYMALAAALIRDLGRQDEAEDLIAKAEQIKAGMNKLHPVLTASEDTSFIMFLALTDKSVDTIIKDVEEGYEYLKDTCKIKASSNGIQGLSEVIAISYGDTREKCDRAVRIFNAFAEHDAKFGSDHEIVVLGSLINLDIDTDTLVREILDTETRFKELKGFKNHEMDRKARMMYASMLAAGVYGRHPEVIDNSVLSNTMSTIIAKQIASAISVAANIASAALSGAGALAGDSEEAKEEL